MQINCKPLFELVGEQKSFDYQMPNTAEKLWENHPISTPISLKGRIVNRAGMVNLEYDACFTVQTKCDRCLADLERECCYQFVHPLIQKLHGEEEDEYIVLPPDLVLDLDELAASDISLELPTKILCRDDCKGLCPQCGKDLNTGSCGCVTEEGDPRLAKLRELLQ